MAQIDAKLRKAWHSQGNSTVDVIIRVEGDLNERADALESRGYQVRRTLRLAHRLVLRCPATRALQLSRFHWITEIESDQPLHLFGTLVMTQSSPGKISPACLLRSLNQVINGQQLSIIVRYSADRRVMRHQQHVHGVSPGYAYRLRPLAQMQATASAIVELESNPDVVGIYQDMPMCAFLNTAVPQTQVPRLWADGFSGEGVRIAVVDTGIDLHHPDLAGRIAGTADFTGEGLTDHHGHGTHCAGIAAGSGDASGGTYRGVAPKASIYAAKVLGSDGQGMMSDVMAGVEWAVSQNVQIISLSLGGIGPSNGQDALSDICNAAVEAGVIVVTAAGNDGPYAYTIGSPGAAERVITIGAVNDGDRLASFSSRGPTADGRTKPDIVLPGVDVIAPARPRHEPGQRRQRLLCRPPRAPAWPRRTPRACALCCSKPIPSGHRRISRPS